MIAWNINTRRTGREGKQGVGEGSPQHTHSPTHFSHPSSLPSLLFPFTSYPSISSPLHSPHPPVPLVSLSSALPSFLLSPAESRRARSSLLCSHWVDRQTDRQTDRQGTERQTAQKPWRLRDLIELNWLRDRQLRDRQTAQTMRTCPVECPSSVSPLLWTVRALWTLDVSWGTLSLYVAVQWTTSGSHQRLTHGHCTRWRVAHFATWPLHDPEVHVLIPQVIGHRQWHTPLKATHTAHKAYYKMDVTLAVFSWDDTASSQCDRIRPSGHLVPSLLSCGESRFTLLLRPHLTRLDSFTCPFNEHCCEIFQKSREHGQNWEVKLPSALSGTSVPWVELSWPRVGLSEHYELCTIIVVNTVNQCWGFMSHCKCFPVESTRCRGCSVYVNDL